MIVRAASLPGVQDRFVAQSGVAIARASHDVLREVAERRAACLTATPEGVAALARLRQVRHRFFEELLVSWPVEDRDRLAPLLERLAHEFRTLGGHL